MFKFSKNKNESGFTTGRLLMMAVVGIIVSASILTVYNYLKNNLKITRGPAANLEKPSWFKTAKEAKESLATVAPAPEPDFIADGRLNLRQENEEMETWTFLYEEAGKPPQIAYLTFNFRSQCDFGAGVQICNTKKFENRLKVHLEGTKNGNDVTVIKLKVI